MNVAVPFTIDTVHSSVDRTVADTAWSAPDLDPDTGLVALEDVWARSHGLPDSQRFPWDDAKGLYILNGFYNLHCLVSSAGPKKCIHTHDCPAYPSAIHTQSLRRSNADTPIAATSCTASTSFGKTLCATPTILLGIRGESTSKALPRILSRALGKRGCVKIGAS